jgi:outer membrane protein TolC
MELTLFKHQVIILQRQKKILLTQLNTLLNRPADSSLAKPQQLIGIVKLPSLEQLQIKAIHSRPELKAITATINAHKSKTDLAELAYYPDLKLSAGYNSLWDNEDKRFNIGIGINIPLDQSKRRAAVQEAKANKQKTDWKKVDLQAQNKQEVAIVYAHTEESLYVLHLYQQQLLPLANETLAAANTDYQSGNADFLSLINSKKKRLQIQLETEKALANVHRHFAKLEQAIGSISPLLTAAQKGNVAQ